MGIKIKKYGGRVTYKLEEKVGFDNNNNNNIIEKFQTSNLKHIQSRDQLEMQTRNTHL